MKANALMIGDWVMCYNPSKNVDDYATIIGICPIEGSIEPYTFIVQFPDNSFLVSTRKSWVKPIPLTAEILEKNGFRYELDYGQFYRSILGDCAKEKEPYVSIRWNSRGEVCCWEVSNKPSFMSGAVAYGYDNIHVHQLQHALRLCGLNELADNFKIEMMDVERIKNALDEARAKTEELASASYAFAAAMKRV